MSRSASKKPTPRTASRVRPRTTTRRKPMAERKVPITTKEEEAPVHGPKDASAHVGLLHGGKEPEYVEHAREHRILIGAQYYDHVGEDAHGIWLYRPVS